MSDAATSKRTALIAALLRQLSEKRDLDEAATILVNDLRQIIPAEQICFGKKMGKKARVLAVSNVPHFDPNSSYRFWIEHFHTQAADSQENMRASVSEFAGDRDMWARHSPSCALMISDPMFAGGHFIACFSREPLSDSDAALVKTAFFNVAHQSLRERAIKFKFSRRDRIVGIVALIVLIILFIPVRIKASIPAEVVSSRPFVVTAPFQGVVSRVTVDPGQQVTPDMTLVEFDQQELLGELEIRKERLNAAKADVERLSRLSFSDPSIRGKIISAESLIETSAAEMAFAEQRLQKSRLQSKIEGVAVLANPDQLRGKPVALGERILEVADPTQVEVGFFTPLSDTHILASDETILTFYPVSRPWSGDSVKLRYCEFAPSLDSRGVAGNKCRASFTDHQTPPFGMSGMLLAAGPRVSIASYLLRKPIFFLRSLLAI